MNKIRYIIINALLAAMGYVLWKAWRAKEEEAQAMEDDDDLDDFIGEPSPVIEVGEGDEHADLGEEDENVEEEPEEELPSRGLGDEDFDDLEGLEEESSRGLEDIEDELTDKSFSGEESDELEGVSSDEIEGTAEDITTDGEGDGSSESFEPDEGNEEVDENESQPVLEVDETLPWHIGQYHIDKIWEETKGEGVKVAILDSGILHGHPDLDSEDCKDFTDENGDSNDTDGHGTHCAGIVCAKVSADVRGIAPNCKLYVAKIAESDFDVTNERVAKALKWAIQEVEVDIVMMSFSLRRKNEGIEKLLLNAKERVIFVGATSKFLFPSSYVGCIGIADIDKNQYTGSDFDRYKAVDLAAPGIEILSTFTNPLYKTDSGSSMATAFAAGVLALLKAYADKENIDVLPEKYAQILEETALVKGDLKIIQPLEAFNELKQLQIA